MWSMAQSPFLKYGCIIFQNSLLKKNPSSIELSLPLVKNQLARSSHHGTVEANLTRNHEVEGSASLTG